MLLNFIILTKTSILVFTLHKVEPFGIVQVAVFADQRLKASCVLMAELVVDE